MSSRMCLRPPDELCSQLYSVMLYATTLYDLCLICEEGTAKPSRMNRDKMDYQELARQQSKIWPSQRPTETLVRLILHMGIDYLLLMIYSGQGNPLNDVNVVAHLFSLHRVMRLEKAARIITNHSCHPYLKSNRPDREKGAKGNDCKQ